MKKSLAILGLAMAGIIASTGIPRLFRPSAQFSFAGRSRDKGASKPAGSKLARMAREQRVAVRHGGMRLDSPEGIAFRQVHK